MANSEISQCGLIACISSDQKIKRRRYRAEVLSLVTQRLQPRRRKGKNDPWLWDQVHDVPLAMPEVEKRRETGP